MNTTYSCPNCKEQMEAGTFRLSGSLLGFIVFGLSMKHLYFKSKNGERRVVLGNSNTTYGYVCPTCDLCILR